jgi:hypothetical protein
MIQAAHHSEAFWPNQGADVIPTDKNKDPSEASLGSCTRVFTAQALGERGAWKRPAFVTLSRIAFRNLYQIAHKDCMADLLSTDRESEPFRTVPHRNKSY